MDEQPTNVPNSSSGEPFQPLQPASNLSGPNWPDIGMRQEEETMSVDQNQEQEEEHKKEDQAPQEQPDQQIETENLDQEEPLHENKLEETEANLSERIHEQLEPQSQEVMEPPYPQQNFQQENFQDFQTHATDLHEEEGHQQNVHSVPESNLQNETQNQLSNLQQMEEQQQQFVPQQPQTMSSPSQFQQGQQPHHQTTFSTQQPQTIPPPSQFQQGQQQHQSTLSPQQPQTIPLPSQFQQGQQHESTLSHNLSEQQSLPQAIEQQHQSTISHNLSEQQSLPQVLEQQQQQENVHQQGLSSSQAQQQSSQKKVFPQSQQQQQISQTMQVHQTPTTQPQLHHHMAQHQQHIGLQQQQQHQLQQQQQMQQVQQQHQHQQIQQQQPHLGPQQQQHMQQQKQLQQQIFHQQPGSHPLQMQHQAQPQSQQQIQHQNPQPKHQQIQYQKIPHPQAQHPQIPHPQAQQQHQLSQVHMPRQQMQMQRQPQLSPLASQTSMGQLSNAAARRPNHHANSISFGSLIPIIMPKISKEQAQQLQGLYQKLRNNEVTKEDFLRMTRTIVGDQMLVTAVRQMQMKVQQQHAESQTAQGSQQRLQQQQSHFQPQLPQQNLPSLSSNESTAFPQIPPLNIHSQTQQPPDYQFQSPSTAPHSSADGIGQHSMQSGEQRSDPSNLNMNQNSSINLHQVKHEVDRTMASRQLPNQHQQMSTAQPPFAMYARAHSSYSGHAFPVSAGISQPNALKPPIFDSQIRGTMHPQGPMQSQGIAAPVANPKVMSKFESQKLPRRLEDDDRLKTLQAGAHLSTQHHQGVWGTAIEREQTLSTTMSASTQAIVKQEANDESFDQQNKMRTLQAGTDNSFAVKGSLDQGQSFSQQKPESAEQLMKTSGTLTMNQTFNSAGTHTEHAMQGQHRAQLPSTAPSVPAGSQIKTPTKKSVLGHKKPNDNIGSSQTPSKKQKVSGSFPDQSIDQLNDVTAVSGVNLREEEEQLFAGSKEESHTTEAMRRVVQEEEERMFLEKGPLHDKIVEIMAKCGIKNIGSDTERCLSLGVEERMRTMISGLIKLSRQREDKERGKHKVVITSDVRSQIQQINKKAKDEWEKKQAEEAEKLRKVTEVENNVEIEKEETRSKAQKPNKEEEDKMRANAANVAARAAIGGDDLLTKWQFLAEQARQKREGASDGTASNVRGNKEMKKKPTSVLKSAGGSEQQEVDKRNDKMIGPAGNAGRNPGPSSQIKFTGTITLNDLIAYLESEPQMTKSNVLYRLYVMGALQNKDT